MGGGRITSSPKKTGATERQITIKTVLTRRWATAWIEQCIVCAHLYTIETPLLSGTGNSATIETPLPSGTGVGADSVPPQILSPRTQSASGNCPPRTLSASRYCPPSADIVPPPPPPPPPSNRCLAVPVFLIGGRSYKPRSLFASSQKGKFSTHTLPLPPPPSVPQCYQSTFPPDVWLRP